MSSTRTAMLLGWLLLAVFLALRVPALMGTSPTWDEPIYVGAGKHLAVNGDRRAAALRYHPPLAYHLTSLPLWWLDTELYSWDDEGPSTQVGTMVLYESRTLLGNEVSPRTVLLLCRLPVLLLGLLGMEMVRRLGRRFFDERTGWIAAYAWALHPGLAAHGVLVTTDLVAVVAAVFLAVSLVDYHDVSERPDKRARNRLIRLGVAAGLALLAKHSLIPAVAIALVFAVIWRRAKRTRGEDLRPGAVGRVVGAGIVTVLVLWAGYLYEVRPVALSDARPRAASEALARYTPFDVDTIDDLAENVPVPAATYVQSLADAVLVKGRARSGTPWVAYMNGEWSEKGFWLYFPFALLVKTPLALLLLLGAGLAGWWQLRKDRADLPDFFLALFVVPIAVAVVSRLNIGVRHVLPAIPFGLLLGAAAVSRLWESRKRVAVGALAILGLLAVAEWVPSAGDPLSFANLPAGGPDRLHRRLADSNLDWGQDLWRLEAWVEENNVEVVRCHLHLPPGLFDVERERFPYLRGRPDDLPELASRIRAEDQAGDIPRRGLLAIGESEMVRPRYAHLGGIEPLARVGRIRIYRLP